METNILFKTHQHFITLILKVIKSFLIIWTFWSISIYLITNDIIKTIIWIIILFILIYIYHYFFYSKSYFYITNDRLSIDVRNWFFSQYNMSIYFNQIKDMAYSKNNFLHYIFNYWVLFIRSSAWTDWNFIVSDVPNIEELYKKVSFMYSLSIDERKSLVDICAYQNKNITKEISKEEIINKVKKELLSINWIKEVKLLTNDDKKYIFENEEDRNHWVYECIKRQITFVMTHDSNFRNALEPIVLKLWNKVIFPPVSFTEISEKNTISSSPWLKVHNYLTTKLNNVWEMDATLLLWFDI